MMTKANKYGGFSITVDSPAGKYTIFFMEDVTTGVLQRMDIQCGKAGTELRAWTTSVSELISALLEEKKITIKDILTHFSSQTTEKSVRDSNTMLKVSSGPEAIVTACHKYMTTKAVNFLSESGHNSLRIYSGMDSDRNASYVMNDKAEFYAQFMHEIRDA